MGEKPRDSSATPLPWRAAPRRVHPGSCLESGPAYLAVAALFVVSFGLGAITIGLHARGGGWDRALLALGLAQFLAGVFMLGLALWLAGPPKAERRHDRLD